MGMTGIPGSLPLPPLPPRCHDTSPTISVSWAVAFAAHLQSQLCLQVMLAELTVARQKVVGYADRAVGAVAWK